MMPQLHSGIMSINILRQNIPTRHLTTPIFYLRAKYIDKAIEAASLLIDKFQKSEFYEPTFYKLGYYYEKIADFSNASKYYEITLIS